jgi:DnaJ domain
MQLPGRLAASTLGDLLGALHRHGITGELELLEQRGLRGSGVPGRRHRIHLCRGLVTLVESDVPVTPLGEILRREGLVAASAIGWALGRIKAGDPRASGEILLQAGFARPEYIRAGLRKQIKQRLDALFAMEDAVVAFHTARPRGDPTVRMNPLWPAEFLHGRPRSRDRARRPGAPAAPPASASPREESPPPRSGTRDVPLPDERDRARRLLGIGASASLAEVRRAFRRLAVELHPDRHAGAPSEEQRKNAARFARISEAYHLLVA